MNIKSLAASAANSSSPSASSSPTVVVAGATGQTGRCDLERLAALPNASVVAGVQNVAKVEKALGGAARS